MLNALHDQKLEKSKKQHSKRYWKGYNIKMKTELINILELICPNNVYLQGTLAQDEPYPESFITFWTNYTADNSHFENDVYSVDWDFNVIYYSSDPALVGSVPNTIISNLRAAGFIPQGKGRDIVSDVPTHTGWAMEFIKTEYSR